MNQLLVALALVGLGALIAVSVLAVYSIQTQRQLLDELRSAIQQWRNRVMELERERDGLIQRVASVQGVVGEQVAAKAVKRPWEDIEGNTHYPSGEVRDVHGRVILQAGASEVEDVMLEGFGNG